MSLGDLILAPAYAAFGVAATLTVAAADYAVTVIPLLQIQSRPSRYEQGLRAFDGHGGVTVPTLAPRAAVRATDITALGLSRGDLDGAVLALDGATWTVRSVEPQPSPSGEGDGEYLMYLEGT